MTVVGGLGGGGDLGLALILAECLRLQPTSVVSFNRCKPSSAPGLPAGGAARLLRPGETGSPRLFEDKLYAAGLDIPAYIVCARAPWSEVQRGLMAALSRSGARSIILADIGGDGLLLGYESELGSYKVDTVARAALAWAQREHGVRALIAVGAIGAEAGGAIPLEEVAASLALADRKGALRAVVAPGPEHLGRAEALLRVARSDMLPLFIAAVRGARSYRGRLYIRGEVTVEPWYRYVALLDPLAHCRISPLCTAALQGGYEAISRRPEPWRPPREYRELVRAARSRGPGRLIMEVLQRRLQG